MNMNKWHSNWTKKEIEKLQTLKNIAGPFSTFTDEELKEQWLPTNPKNPDMEYFQQDF